MQISAPCRFLLPVTRDPTHAKCKVPARPALARVQKRCKRLSQHRKQGAIRHAQEMKMSCTSATASRSNALDASKLID